MKRIIPLLSFGLVTLVAMAAEPAPAPVLQMRLVADSASADTEDMVYVDQQFGKKETLHVMKTVLIDQTGVKSAMVPKANLPQVNLKFTNEARKRLAEVVRENAGQRLAMVIGGKVYSAPKLMKEVPFGEAVIVVSSKAEAKALVTQITEPEKK